MLGRSFVGGYSSKKSRLDTEIQCVILWTRRGKKNTGIFVCGYHTTIVRAGPDSSGMRGSAPVSNSPLSCSEPDRPDGEERSEPECSWVAWITLLPGLFDVVPRLEGRVLRSRTKAAGSTAWLATRSVKRGRQSVLDAEGSSREQKLEDSRPGWLRA